MRRKPMKQGDRYYSIHGCDAEGWRLMVYEYKEFKTELGNHDPRRDFLSPVNQRPLVFGTFVELALEMGFVARPTTEDTK